MFFPEHPVEITLLGTQTVDSFRAGNALCCGGIANAARYLKSKNVCYMPIQHADFDYILEEVTWQSNVAPQWNIPHSEWTHISYLDWLNLSETDFQYIRDRSHVVSADIAGDPTNYYTNYYKYIDVLFCTAEQSKEISDWPALSFIHSKELWTIYSTSKSEYHQTSPPDISFTLGAGDMLVAATINNLLPSRAWATLSPFYDKIEEELNANLLARQAWYDKIS